MKPDDIIEWWDFLRQRALKVFGVWRVIIFVLVVTIFASIWYWPQINFNICARFPEFAFCQSARMIGQKKLAALKIGYNILLWSGFKRAGVQIEGISWNEKGVMEVHLLEADIKEKAKTLDVTIDFPPSNTLSKDDYVYKFLEYDSELRARLGKGNGEYRALYEFGFALGAAILQTVSAKIDKSSATSPDSLLRILDGILTKSRSSNLPKEVLEEIKIIKERLMTTGLSSDTAQLYGRHLKHVMETAEKIVSR
jgi:hypothetical protein